MKSLLDANSFLFAMMSLSNLHFVQICSWTKLQMMLSCSDLLLSVIVNEVNSFHTNLNWISVKGGHIWAFP